VAPARLAALGLLICLAPAVSRAESAFLANLRKAQSRTVPDERIEYYGRAIASWKASDSMALLGDCRFRRGEALAERYDFAEALPDLSAALSLDDGNARARFLRGRALMHLDRAQQAAADFKAYTALRGEDSEGWLALGEAEGKAGRPNDAQKTYRRAEQLAPTDFRPALGRARLLAEKSRCKEALTLLDRADAIAGGRSPEVLAERADCLFELGGSTPEQGLALPVEDYGKAISLYEARLLDLRRSQAPAGRLLEEQGKAAPAFFGRGRLYELLQKLPEAASDYAQACELGHQQACDKAKSLSGRPAPPSRKAPEAAKPPKPEPKPKKRSFEFKGEPGDRIYAN